MIVNVRKRSSRRYYDTPDPSSPTYTEEINTVLAKVKADRIIDYPEIFVEKLVGKKILQTQNQ